MANDREEEPKVTIIDRRMLSDDDRAGKAEPTPVRVVEPVREEAPAPTPAPAAEAAVEKKDSIDVESYADSEGEFEDEAGEPLSEEEIASMRAEVEAEQFAAIEARLGRSLTETEKEQVRGEMEAQAQEQQRQMSTLEVSPMIQQFMAEISARAAIHMGLMPNPYTRLIAKNDTEARLAIDVFAAVFETLKPRLESGVQKEYSRVLNDLRVNFSQQTGLPAGGFGGSFGSGGSPKIIH